MHVHVRLLSQDSTFDLFNFFPKFFSKICVAKLGVRLICECGLYSLCTPVFTVLLKLYQWYYVPFLFVSSIFSFLNSYCFHCFFVIHFNIAIIVTIITILAWHLFCWLRFTFSILAWSWCSSLKTVMEKSPQNNKIVISREKNKLEAAWLSYQGAGLEIAGSNPFWPLAGVVHNSSELNSSEFE